VSRAFFDDGRAHRARWKIKAPPQNPGLHYAPLYTVDYSFSSGTPSPSPFSFLFSLLFPFLLI
jgi:hypothetical protein